MYLEICIQENLSRLKKLCFGWQIIALLENNFASIIYKWQYGDKHVIDFASNVSPTVAKDMLR
jgi:hypothetical protein